ncbi:DNA polymerase III subunit beta [Prosthecobacter vanneervenii]|uniref:Beta sliding clamp n=1 Tax=Prosthecobacter vanneervenii TaxID=48466 RepID=A0A7W8DIX5_9BACT|nr:DNA polymerase III subunit beta [Prosthecobacter vanneervenii]MBB5031564.1 DNA polymerase III sliding clamp (beta) subunit (PCNA family) [Prosthecobacter vanneervenii]
MNPISLPVAELKPALVGLGKVINSRSTLPVLQYVKVERTTDGWVALTSTDLDRFVTVRLEQPSTGPAMTVFIPHEQLVQLTKNSDRNESLLIDTTPGGPVIKFALADNLGESKVKLIPLAEFPVTPRLPGESIPLPSELRHSIHEAMECASIDETRYVLNGTFIDASNPKANYIVGTDGRHLYSANSFALPLKNSVLIPNNKFLGWKEFDNDGEWQLKADGTTVQISSRRWRFISKQIDGKYPDWRVTVPNPSDARTHVTLDPAKLDALIKLIQRMPCHDPDKYQTIGLECQQGQFMLLGRDTPDTPWTRVPVLDAKIEGQEVSIFLCRRYLIKALEYGLNTISLNEEIHPLRFHHKGRQMIVMPLRIDGPSSRKPATPQPAPVNPPPSRPVPPPAPPPQPMITHPTSEGPASGEPKSATEEVIDLTLLLRDKLNEGFNLLRELSLKLKAINRDQKTSARELNSVRSTLRSLQGLKL